MYASFKSKWIYTSKGANKGGQGEVKERLTKSGGNAKKNQGKSRKKQRKQTESSSSGLAV
jgi:hypothetical protein